MITLMTFKNSLCIASLLLTSAYVSAQDNKEDKHRLRVGLAAVSSDSIYQQGDRQNKVFPAFDYEYENFYFQAGDAGYKILDGNVWQLN